MNLKPRIAQAPAVLLALACLCWQVLAQAPPANPFVFAKPAMMQGKLLPVPEKLRTPDFAGYAALQFGPGVDDVAYLTFDCKAQYKQHDVMYVFVRGHADYGESVSVCGIRDDNGKISFRKVGFKTVFGDNEVQYMLTLHDVATDWPGLAIGLPFRLNVTVIDAGKRRTAFALVGRLKATLNANAALEVSPTLARPTLDVAWNDYYGKQRVRAQIEVGDHALIPDSCFASWASIVILEGDDAPRIKLRDRYRIEPYGTSGNFAYEPDPARLKGARPYTAVVKVNLSPLFGELEGRAVTVLR